MRDREKIGEKIEQLKSITEWFYGENFNLDRASEKYKEAVILAKEIEKDLDELKNEIKIIEEDFAKK